MDTFVYKDHKKLRCGYTTGTCAAIAAQGAVRFLLTGSWKETEEIMTPKGIPVCVSLEEKTSGDSWAECAVRKDAGDDYDVTNGILVYARAEFVKDKNFYEKVQMSHLESSGFGAAGEKPGLSPENQKQQKKANAAHQKEALPESLVRIDGGIGIGRITKSGLDQPIGAAAINSVPRKMIRDAVYELLEEAGELRLVSITISVPAGVEAAKKTFNPVLGIEGGISVLGTSGIVEPMSSQALLDTIYVELKQKREEGNRFAAISPGNYGLEYMKRAYGFDLDRSVKCSNFIGKTMDMAVELGFEAVLLTGHIGKLVKLSGGIMDTHSREADARMELLMAAAYRAGCAPDTLGKILDCLVTEDGCLSATMELLMKKILFYLKKRVKEELRVECILYANGYGELARSDGAVELLERIRGEEEHLQ